MSNILSFTFTDECLKQNTTKINAMVSHLAITYLSSFKNKGSGLIIANNNDNTYFSKNGQYSITTLIKKTKVDVPLLNGNFITIQNRTHTLPKNINMEYPLLKRNLAGFVSGIIKNNMFVLKKQNNPTHNGNYCESIFQNFSLNNIPDIHNIFKTLDGKFTSIVYDIDDKIYNIFTTKFIFIYLTGIGCCIVSTRDISHELRNFIVFDLKIIEKPSFVKIFIDSQDKIRIKKEEIDEELINYPKENYPKLPFSFKRPHGKIKKKGGN